MAFRSACGVMIVLLMASVAVQYNDPDGILWMAYYGAALVLTALAMSGRHYVVSPMAAIAYLVGALFAMPKQGGNWLHIEEGREAMGLMICAVWMSVLTAQWFRNRAAALTVSEAPATETPDQN